MDSVKSSLFRAFTRKTQVPIATSRVAHPDQAHVREMLRMRDELRLAREKARLLDVIHRNRIM